MKTKHIKTIYLIIILSMTVSATSTSVINTDNWKEYAKAKNHADINKQETFTIATPPDAKIAEYTIKNPEKLYIGNNSVFKNIENRTSLTFNQKKHISKLETPENAEGLLIIQNKFGTDALSILPYASKRNLALTYYKDNINLEENKKKVFYGNFSFDPEKRYSNAEHIDGTWEERNLKLIEKMKSETVLLSPRNYFDPDELGETPILLKRDEKELSEFIQKSKVDKIKVIAQENMKIAKEIDLLTEKDIRIIAKTGRAYSGIPKYSGVYNIKKMPINHRKFDLKISSVKKVNSSKINIEFLNKGNTAREVKASIKDLNSLQFGLKIPPYTSIARTINIPENQTVFTLKYEADRTKNSMKIDLGNINSGKLQKPLRVKSINKTNQQSKVELENARDKVTWLMYQSSEENEKKKLKPGESAIISADSSKDRITIYQGPFRNQFTRSIKIDLNERKEKRPDHMLYGGLTLALVLFLVVILHRRRSLLEYLAS
jgi:hypothetical protein